MSTVPHEIVDALLVEWDLVPDGQALAAHAVPVRHRGSPAVLKVGTPDTQAHLALTRWEGRGAVRLLRADPHRGALLLERAGPDLRDAWDLEACERIAGLYADLHRPTGAPFPRLSAWAGEVAERLAALPRNGPVPHRMADQAAALARSFATDEATDGVLVHGDLHYAHACESDRGLLAIAAEPLSGDPAFEVAPLLWERFDELAGDVRGGLRRRFHATIDAAMLEEERARDWVVVRAMARAAGAAAAELTRLIAVAKAVQD